MFSASMLQRLFVRGSLKNTPNGFEMKIKNVIETGTLTGLGAVIVDGVAYEPAKVQVSTGNRSVSGDQITFMHQLVIRAYTEVSLQVAGEPLAAGEHQIKLQMQVSEAGPMQINVTELLSE